MVEVVIPPDIVPSEETVEVVDDATAVFRPVFGSGLVQRVQQARPRLRVMQKWRGLRAEDRARMLAVLRAAQGRFITVRAAVGYAMRGSFPASELLANGDFSDGTTGWVASNGALSVSDQVARIIADGSAINVQLQYNGTFNVTQYAAYSMRSAWMRVSRDTAAELHSYFVSGGIASDNGEASPMLVTANSFAHGATAQVIVYDYDSLANFGGGDSFDISHVSCRRCARIDLGTNYLTYSDQFNNAAWTKSNSTVTADSTASPDGTTTADSILDTAVNSTHFVVQNATKSAAAEDWTGVVYLKPNTRTQVRLIVGDTAAGNYAHVFFNLSTGAVLSGPTNVGTVTNARAASTSVGNGWYRYSLTARIPSTVTTGNLFRIGLASGGTDSYLGNGSGVYAWRAGYSNSSLPFVPVQTTTAAVQGSYAGSGLVRVNGLPASTDGLLLPGDFFECNNQLAQATAPLSGDGAGCGVLHFEPAFAIAPSNYAGVIVGQPMGRFILADNPKWTNQYGVYADLELSLEQIYEP